MQGLTYGEKFTFQNRLGQLVVYSRANCKYKPPRGLIFGGADLTEGFCVTILGGLSIEGLIFGILPYFHDDNIKNLLYYLNQSVPLRFKKH